MQPHRKLGNIANIQFGLHQTSQVKGEVKYLLVRHFDNDIQPTRFEESFIAMDDRVGKSLLKHHDVLFAGKGFRQFAWTYDESFGATVASSVFYVIRPDTSILLPEYLTIILNSEKIKHTLRVISLGVAIPSIPKTELKEIKIPTPPIEQQKKIVEFANWHRQEIALTQQILKKKKTMFNSFVQKIIQP